MQQTIGNDPSLVSKSHTCRVKFQFSICMVILIEFIQNFASTREYLVSVFPLETAEEFVGVEAERNTESKRNTSNDAL